MATLISLAQTSNLLKLTILSLCSLFLISCGGGSSSTPVPPAVPNGFSAQSSIDNINITWQPNSNASAYTIYYQPSPGVTNSSAQISTTGSTANLPSLAANTTYYYRVSAQNNNGSSALSQELSITTSTQAPSNLSSSTSNNTITLNWDAVAGASNYRIEYGLSSGQLTAIKLSNTPNATLNNLTFGTTYHLRVRAQNAGGLSTATNTITQITAPEVPTEFKATGETEGFALEWETPYRADHEYDIYYSLAPNVTTTNGTLVSNVTTKKTPSSPTIGDTVTYTANISGLANSTTYYLILVARNSANSSPATTEVSAQTGPQTPQNLTGTTGKLRAILDWTPIAGATHNVYYSPLENFSRSAAIKLTDVTPPLTVTQLVAGATYHFVVTANNGQSESSNSAPVTLKIDTAKYIYIGNKNSKTISLYLHNTLNVIQHAGYTPLDGEPSAILPSPNQKFLYALTNLGIESFQVQPNGRLQKTSAISLAPAIPSELSITADTKYLYYINSSDNTINGYSIDGLSGTLASPFTAATVSSGNAKKIITSPNNNHCYVITSNDRIEAFTINPNGSLTSINELVTGSSPSSLSITPSGSYVYVTNRLDNNISIYERDANTGALSIVGTGATGKNPIQIEVNPSGEYAYTLNTTDNLLNVYQINSATGNLDLVHSISTHNAPQSFTLSASGTHLHITSNDNEVTTYIRIPQQINFTETTTVSTQDEPKSIATIGGDSDIFITKYIYTTGSSLNIEGFKVEPSSLNLTPISLPPSVNLDTLPSALLSTDTHIYVSQNDSTLGTSETIKSYSINDSDGVISNTPDTPTNGGIIDMVLSPSLATLFTASDASSQALSSFSIANNGTLINNQNIMTGRTHSDLEIDPSGRFLYTANVNNTELLDIYSIHSGNQSLTKIGHITGTADANPQIKVHPSGRFLYLIKPSTQEVLSYKINLSSGLLESISAPVSTGQAPSSALFDSTGRFLFVANRTENSISRFNINLDNGDISDPSIKTTTASNPLALHSDKNSLLPILFLINNNLNQVTAYNMNLQTGVLSKFEDVSTNSPISHITTTGQATIELN